MKTVTLLLVALAMATGPAWALRCHVCTSSTNCRQPQTCSASARFCRTMTTVEPLTGNLVKKDCAEGCVPTNSLQGQVSSGTGATLCCQSDLCNERLSSAAPARTALPSTPLSLAPALGLLALVLAPNL
ncbi:PREDICTED: lymphocyte antigen 6D-like [Galeopterus variegatus]|uniref:Lymphocyte antigen 6D-like n=1 Tax=Galeopterus variegatus TaxID=482537 RepID=A0ABM0RLB1_GALVR|nr:PREDICTED: lymphocyte antigen 6D-like [Galeopterus variegatus]